MVASMYVNEDSVAQALQSTTRRQRGKKGLLSGSIEWVECVQAPKIDVEWGSQGTP